METDELKESLKSMIRSNDVDDAKLAINIIQNNPEYKDMWYNIEDYITKDTERYIEMYSKEGKSDKVYLIVVDRVIHDYKNIRAGSKEFKLTAYYGRRGKTMRSDDKGLIPGYRSYIIDELIHEKVHKKGYKIINEYPKREEE